jgi:hypothetical protein
LAGLLVGDFVGAFVGRFVGLLVGDFVGAFVGLFVGDLVGGLTGATTQAVTGTVHTHSTPTPLPVHDCTVEGRGIHVALPLIAPVTGKVKEAPFAQDCPSLSKNMALPPPGTI